MAIHSAAQSTATRRTPGARRRQPVHRRGEPGLGAAVVPPHRRLADQPVPPEVAYQLIHDELLLDGSARLNLATFVTTWMEPQASVSWPSASTRT